MFKISKLLKALLFGASFLRMGITEGEGGGSEGEGGEGSQTGEGGQTGEPGAGTPSAAPKPSDNEARLLKEVMQKKDALKTATTELTSIKEQLKQFEGIDPAAVRQLLADQKTAEEKQLEAKGDYDRLKARMAEEHQKETSTLKDQIAALQAQLGKATGAIDELSVGAQFAQSDFIKSETTIPPSKARTLYASHFDLEDGAVVGYDKPRGAPARTALVDGLGNALPFEAAMRKIVEADPDRDSLLRSKVKQGAGSESKAKVDTKPRANLPADSTSKIAAGLKGLNLLGLGAK